MNISRLSDHEFGQLLGQHLRPSQWIDRPEQLRGRAKHLQEIKRAFYSPGRQVFIYGDRGIGKSSLAITAAHVLTGSSHSPLYIPCGQYSTFEDLVRAVVDSVTAPEQRHSAVSQSGSLNLGYSGATVGGSYSRDVHYIPPHSTTVGDALNALRYVDTVREHKQTVLVFDELERIQSSDIKIRLAELIKNFSTAETSLKLIYCGIGTSISDIIGSHMSAGRYLEPIQLEKLSHDALWEIISSAADALGITIDDGFLIRIGIISDGFPHFVHLIGQCMFWAMKDDAVEVNHVHRRHFESAIHGALQKTEPDLRSAYQRATQKTKNTIEYEEALWALADRPGTARQLDDIYNNSYLRIMRQRRGREPLARHIFNQRLLTLRKNAHGNIVIGTGAGWFRFRENVLRGFVRMKAEHDGFELQAEPVT